MGILLGQDLTYSDGFGKLIFGKLINSKQQQQQQT
jgi:hypothetical protein